MEGERGLARLLGLGHVGVFALGSVVWGIPGPGTKPLIWLHFDLVRGTSSPFYPNWSCRRWRVLDTGSRIIRSRNAARLVDI
jgi:hypothetical protein